MREQLKRLLEERARVWDAARKAAFGEDGQRDSSQMSAEERSAWDKANRDLTDLDRRIGDLTSAIELEDEAHRAQERSNGLQRPGTGDAQRARNASGRELRHYERDEYRDAFNAWMRGGLREVSDEHRGLLSQGAIESRALGTVVGAQGGFTIPQGFYNQLTIAMKAYGTMIPANLGVDLDGGQADGEDNAGTSLIQTESGNPLPFPTENDTTNTGARLAENAQITAQDISFGQVTLNAWIYTSKLILVPWTLLQDSAFDMPANIASTGGKRLGRILNTELTTGAGPSSSMPNGVLTAASLGVTLSSGTATPIYDNLVDLEHSVNRAYRRNGKFMFNDQTLAVVRKLKDTQNRPLWEPNLQAGAPSLFAGKPYVVNDDMPTVGTAGNKSILFGDFSTYKVRVAREITLIRLDERYADYLQTGFFLWMRADGNLVDGGGQAIKYLTQ